jgi:tetratricopeptide (TPR) repeat protein
MWANFELFIIQNRNPIGLEGRILPLMLEECQLPERLSIFTYANFMEINNREVELCRLLNQLGVTVFPNTTAGSYAIGQESEKIYRSKLPTTGSDLFGREKELKYLDDAWINNNTCIVTLVAWGGVGKTALVNRWLNEMWQDRYRGAKKVYCWSFHGQGSEKENQISADEFIQETLKWFGDPNPSEGSPVDKGRRLARLVKREQTLLILDGLESLQYQEEKIPEFKGKLKDPGMREFLNKLVDNRAGLCVITTRENVADLSGRLRYGVVEMKLEHLSVDAGAQLLKSLEVRGSENDIMQAVKEYGGHALSLTLLGKYLQSRYEGDIRKRDRIPPLNQVRHGGHNARRMMEAYEKCLEDSPQRHILYVMGLFNQLVEGEAVEALKTDPPIPGVMEQLQKLSEDEWQIALFDLKKTGLLAKENPQRPGTLDCHPLIREHFGRELREQNPEGWKVAHTRLYNYYKNLPENESPDNLLEMEPLFAAIVHGCQAGLHQEALLDVFWKRLCREEEGFVFKKIGAFGSSLAALSHFFDVPWSTPAPGLNEHDKASLLGWTAFCLRAVGRLEEAILPRKGGLEIHVKLEDWKNAAMAANNLSELMLTRGELEQAVDYGRKSVEYADKSKDDFQRMSRRTTLADALHQSGQLKEAEELFREAEVIQIKRELKFPFLFSLWGFRFCDLLLSQGKYREVIERTKKALEESEKEGKPLNIGLDNLSLGRAQMMQVKEEGSSDFTRAMDYLKRAVERLREAKVQDYILRGLLARGECYRRQREFPKARQDLEEAQEIADIGGMRLFLCDYHLEAGRLCEAENKTEEAEAHFMSANKMMVEMDYMRRTKELGKKSDQNVEKLKVFKKFLCQTIQKLLSAIRI